MSIAALRRAVLLVVVASTVLGCGRVERFLAEQPGPVINGERMGPRLACEADAADQCAEMTAIALPRLDAKRPAHAEIVGVTLFGQPLDITTSGSTTYVVFELADETLVVVSVYCGVGGCSTEYDSP